MNREQVDSHDGEVSALLDRLAKSDAASAPQGFEVRIGRATAPMLESASTPPTFDFSAAASSRNDTSRIGAGSALRLAAAMALAATVGAVVVAQRGGAFSHVVAPQTQVAAAESDEALFALVGWAEGQSDDLAEIRTQTESLDKTIGGGWDLSDLLTDEGAS
ncbi:MAG: hypothetical protein JSR77_17225 [Planctomycetes bacterium]|nr:hypothetical protein [Planctomycetota bacterium]